MPLLKKTFATDYSKWLESNVCSKGKITGFQILKLICAIYYISIWLRPNKLDLARFQNLKEFVKLISTSCVLYFGGMSLGIQVRHEKKMVLAKPIKRLQLCLTSEELKGVIQTSGASFCFTDSLV